MTLGFLRSIGLVLLATLPLCAAEGPQTQTAARPATDQSIPAQNSEAAPANSSASEQRPAPVAPTLAEMRAMTADQLEETGDQLRRAKDYLSAIDCYREAVRKHATAEDYNKIAVSEIMLKHWPEAEKAAKKAIHKNKKFAEAWNNLGVTYYSRYKYEDAIHSYQRAISINPDLASYHNNMAAALIDTNQFEDALKEYRKAFQLDNSFFERASHNGINAKVGSHRDQAEFSFVMARLFASTGDIDRALHFLRSAMEDGYPKIDDVYRNKDFALLRNDDRFLALMKERPVAVQ